MGRRDEEKSRVEQSRGGGASKSLFMSCETSSAWSPSLPEKLWGLDE